MFILNVTESSGKNYHDIMLMGVQMGSAIWNTVCTKPNNSQTP